MKANDCSTLYAACLLDEENTVSLVPSTEVSRLVCVLCFRTWLYSIKITIRRILRLTRYKNKHFAYDLLTMLDNLEVPVGAYAGFNIGLATTRL